MLFSKSIVPLSAVLLFFAAMCGSLICVEVLKPTQFWSVAIGSPQYADHIPTQFGEWKEVPYVAKSIVDPIQAESLAKLYSETYGRAFMHAATGRVIMLSIAYGKNQSTDTQLHTPDQCYPSQGFRILNRKEREIHTLWGDLKSVQLETALGVRNEPLTYFIRVGDKVVRGSKERNLARLDMALKGYLVDGLLVRVSEITQKNDSFSLQEKFIKDFLGSMSPADRSLFIGKMN